MSSDTHIIELLAKYKRKEVTKILYAEAVNDFFFNKFHKVDHDTDFVAYLFKQNMLKMKHMDDEEIPLVGAKYLFIKNGALRHELTGMLCSLDRLDCESAYEAVTQFISISEKMRQDVKARVSELMEQVPKHKKLTSLNHLSFCALAEALFPIEGTHSWKHGAKNSTLTYCYINPDTGLPECKSLTFNHAVFFKDLENGLVGYKAPDALAYINAKLCRHSSSSTK